jgi:F-type H+-transporting ATPase subunit b
MFDFDATLPIIAVQFLVLMALLNALFFKPLNRVIDDRENYISSNETEARERLAKAESLTKEYELQLTNSRKQYQQVIAQAQAEAKKLSDSKIAQAVKEAQAKKESAYQEIEIQRQKALSELENQVESLSQKVLTKILGPELVK